MQTRRTQLRDSWKPSSGGLDDGHPFRWRTWWRARLPRFLVKLGFAAQGSDCERVGGWHRWSNRDGKHVCYHCRTERENRLNEEGAAKMSAGVPTDARLQRAREIFFRYDGSHFYMNHDGVEDEYRSTSVPAETERRWMAELTEEKLADLADEGNYRAVRFLNHHSNYEHLSKLLAAVPKGDLFQRCAFLEELLDYAAKAPPAQRVVILDKVMADGTMLLPESDMTRRVHSLLELARERSKPRGG